MSNVFALFDTEFCNIPLCTSTFVSDVLVLHDELMLVMMLSQIYLMPTLTGGWIDACHT